MMVPIFVVFFWFLQTSFAKTIPGTLVSEIFVNNADALPLECHELPTPAERSFCKGTNDPLLADMHFEKKQQSYCSTIWQIFIKPTIFGEFNSGHILETACSLPRPPLPHTLPVFDKFMVENGFWGISDYDNSTLEVCCQLYHAQFNYLYTQIGDQVPEFPPPCTIIEEFSNHNWTWTPLPKDFILPKMGSRSDSPCDALDSTEILHRSERSAGLTRPPSPRAPKHNPKQKTTRPKPPTSSRKPMQSTSTKSPTLASSPPGISSNGQIPPTSTHTQAPGQNAIPPNSNGLGSNPSFRSNPSDRPAGSPHNGLFWGVGGITTVVGIIAAVLKWWRKK